jgi:hypothetical protein
VTRSVGLALLALVAIAALPSEAAAKRLQLPVVEIHAANEIVNEPKRPATMRVRDRDGRADYDGRIGIELRGQSTLLYDPKKSYAVETRKRSGKNLNVSLLGMPADDDWVLIANYVDESLLRNFVVYSTGRWLDRYAPRSRLVEVYVNGSYEGVYLMAERLKLHERRVAIDDSKVSGGYLLEMIEPVRSPGEKFFTTPITNLPVVYKDPKRGDLSRKRENWIRDYVGRFERRLYGDQFTDRERGYRRYLDMGAAVDFLLLNELFRNGDTFRVSTYMHKGVGGKLVLGPLWDFDHAVGNSAYDEFNGVSGFQYGSSPWAGRLYSDPAFRTRLAARWRELRSRGLLRQVMRLVDRGAGQLAGGPQERNFARWPVFEQGLVEPVDPRTGAPPANHAQAVDYLKWWLTERTKAIDSAFG